MLKCVCLASWRCQTKIPRFWKFWSAKSKSMLLLWLPSIHSFSIRKTMREKKNSKQQSAWHDFVFGCCRTSKTQSCIFRLSAIFWLLAVRTRYSWRGSGRLKDTNCCKQADLSHDTLACWKNYIKKEGRKERKKASLKQMGRGAQATGFVASWHFHESRQAWDGHVDTKNSHSPRLKLLPKCRGDSLNKLCMLDDNNLNVV